MVKKKQNKKLNKISKIIYGIFFILFTILLLIIFYLKLLPVKYTTTILVIYLFLNILFSIFLLRKKTKPSIKIFFNIICFLFSVIFILSLYYLNKTINFMDKIKALAYQTENYYVIVLEESNYTNIKDIEDESVGMYQLSNNSYQEALTKLNNKVNIKTLEYNNIINLGDSLLKGKLKAIFINETYLSFITDELTTFENDTKIIDTIKIKVKNNANSKEIDVTKESFNIYISGIDVYGDISSISRSDVNMIVTVNPTKNKILLTSIPRDYYVRLHGTTGYKDKLTHSGIYGIDMSIKTIEDLLDIDINYYIRVNFTTLIKLVDAIGGINIYSDIAFTAHTNSKCKYVEGNNYLTGECALAFSRERYAYKSGDRHRVQNQQVVITAILNKALSSSTLVTKYVDILESLGDSFQTNMPSNKIYSLVNMQLDKMPSWDIEQISLNGTDNYNYTYSYPTGKLYVMEPDINTIAIAINKINEAKEN